VEQQDSWLALRGNHLGEMRQGSNVAERRLLHWD